MNGHPGEVMVRGSAAGFAQEIIAGPHRMTAAEPAAAGGTETGPGPYDLLLAALGSCTSMTVAMYARRKAWPLASVTVWLRHSRIYAADCTECDTKEGRLDRIERDIQFVGPLKAEQRAKLLEIANKCPVHRTLTRRSASGRERCKRAAAFFGSRYHNVVLNCFGHAEN